DTFKSLDDNFFIISSGLDNASANIPQKSMNQYSFMIQMNEEVPGIFKKIDALGSHSYPNPGFSSFPWIVTDKSISSFKFEKELADELSGKNLPIFITETGWSNKNLSKNQIASYFIFAFESVWLDNVVAVTPFLLHAGVGPFSQFSLLNEDGNYNEVSLTLQRIPKIKGKPTINYNSNLTSNLLPSQNNIPVRTFSQKTQFEYPALEKTKTITTFFKWLLKLPN
ncbi:MAG: hypothetical protein HY424_03110, partial [Candidatus Levybacteria bacterium]|nr:hypothetical protein [Candidatus Levybacteria bacterium]